MISAELKNKNAFSFVAAGLAFTVACAIQAADNCVKSPEIGIIMGLTAQFIFFGIMAYWTVSLISRVSVNSIRIGFTLTVSFMALLLFIRLIKYNVFHDETAVRYLWYAYYIPLCFSPAFLLLTVLGTKQNGVRSPTKQWYFLLVFAAMLVLMVFTNDIHRFVFAFPSGLEYANEVYTWGPGYYIILAWIAVLYLASGVLLYIKCFVSSCRKKAWVPLVLFILCVCLCLLREVFDPTCLRMPETVAFSVIIVCESLMRIGFIPTNVEYARFFDVADISASIADSGLKTVLRSKNAPQITYGQAKAAAESGKMALNKDSVLRARAIRGGEVFWTEDLSVINKVNGELAETNQTLSEEGYLIAAENRLKEQRSKIEEQNKLYEGMFALFRPHLRKIQAAFSNAETEKDRDSALRLALVYGAYLKRRSNLSMLAKDGEARFSELLYSVRESTDAMSFYGTVSTVVCEGDGVYPIEQIIFLYEFFEDCIESALPGLSACFVRLEAEGERLSCRIALENCTAQLPDNWRKNECIKHRAVLKTENVDETVYVMLSIGRGEEAI